MPELRRTWKNCGDDIVFYILISNTDDHLRNLGFLYAGSEGWRLAPAYDLNPMPVETKPRVLSTNISLDDGTASLELAFEVTDYFKLSAGRAREIAWQLGKVVVRWDKEAGKLGIGKTDRERVASAFEHDDLQQANQIR